MSEVLAQLEKKGGGEMTLYLYEVPISENATGSVTVSKNGYLVACMNLTYGLSGYVRLKKNGTYVINETNRSSYWYDSKVNKGDVISWEQNSGTKSYVAILTE